MIQQATTCLADLIEIDLLALFNGIKGIPSPSQQKGGHRQPIGREAKALIERVVRITFDHHCRHALFLESGFTRFLFAFLWLVWGMKGDGEEIARFARWHDDTFLEPAARWIFLINEKGRPPCRNPDGIGHTPHQYSFVTNPCWVVEYINTCGHTQTTRFISSRELATVV
jgi:hypothetical protein